MKKACPSASTILDGVRSENFGLNRKVNPSLPPPDVIFVGNAMMDTSEENNDS